MADNSPVFLVNPYTDPVVIRINGRASYLNSSPLREFFSILVRQMRKDVLIDFSNCTSVDSTFLGIVAGAALDFMDMEPAGKIKLVALSSRNLELVKNLGLERLTTIIEEANTQTANGEQPLASDTIPQEDRVRMIIAAHEHLVKCDEANAERFQDVLTFMRKQRGGPEFRD
jgi:anti-anti-sigma regulatory factor